MTEIDPQPKTWKDLAEQERLTEEPYAPLEVDVDRWNVKAVLIRLGKVTNSLVKAHEEMARLRKAIHKLGVKSGDAYKTLFEQKIQLEEQIHSLEDKKDYLMELSYHKRQEMKNTQ
jgi:uncharacterized protein (DUF3084 family)